MNLEDQISESLAQQLARLDPTPSDLTGVRRRAGRVRRRRLAVASLAVALVVAGIAVAGTTLGGRDNVDPAPADPALTQGTWTPLPDLPLAPRADAVTGWTGTEALVVGGFLTKCPANVACTVADAIARDGAAYSPQTNSWRRIADPPVGIASHFRSTMIGDNLVIFDGGVGWYAYDASDDAWRRLPSPRQSVVGTGPLASGDGVILAMAHTGSVLAFNLVESRWLVVPDSFVSGARAQTVVTTPHGFVLSGSWLDESPPTIVTQTWDDSRRLPVQTGQFNPFHHWTGQRLVELDLRMTENSDGSMTPHGGILDPRTGRWSPLPDAPKVADDGWAPVAAAGPLMAGGGYVYDDRDQSWARLGRPDGAVAEAGVSSVWAGGGLLVVGGADRRSEPTAQAWLWRS